MSHSSKGEDDTGVKAKRLILLCERILVTSITSFTDQHFAIINGIQRILL